MPQERTSWSGSSISESGSGDSRSDESSSSSSSVSSKSESTENSGSKNNFGASATFDYSSSDKQDDLSPFGSPMNTPRRSSVEKSPRKSSKLSSFGKSPLSTPRGSSFAQSPTKSPRFSSFGNTPRESARYSEGDSDGNSSSNPEQIPPTPQRPPFNDSDHSESEQESPASRQPQSFRWPGSVRKSQFSQPNDVESQKDPRYSQPGIALNRTLSESSSSSDDDSDSSEDESKKPDDKPVEENEKSRYMTRERKIITCLTITVCIVCLLAALGIGIAIGLASRTDHDETLPAKPSTPKTLAPAQPTPTQAPISSMSPSTMPSTLSPTMEPLFQLLIDNSFDDGEALLNSGTPQREAYEWLLENENLDSYTDEVKLSRYALATFFYSTDGPSSWEAEIRDDGWMTDAPECEWASTASNQCTEGVYTSLTLDFVAVSGQIPPELGLLTGLERLSLRSEGAGSPSISGSLPDSIGALESLETIRLNENNIGGTLPTTIGLLTSISVFLLSGNSVGGTIPTEIGLTGGNTFNFDRNQFSGTIPPELFAMETLTALNFEDNFLQGSIPTEIGLSAELNSVNFAGNSLSGRIPSEIGRLVTVKAGIDLSNNEIIGSLPTEIGFLASMQNLLVNNNRLTGTVPSQYETWSDMRLLRIDGNLLDGSMPQEVCDAFSDKTVSYADCGTDSFSCSCCTFCCTGQLCECIAEDETVCETSKLWTSEEQISETNKKETDRS